MWILIIFGRLGRGASGGDDFVIDQTKHKVIGLQSLIAKLVKKAGFVPIPRFPDNCRHSRSIELRNDPTVGPWASAKMLGHTPKVADSCYSGIREEDFERYAAKVTLAEKKPSRYAKATVVKDDLVAAPLAVQTTDV